MKSKKLLAMVCVIVLITGLVLSGCTSQETPPPPSQQEEEEEEIFELTYGVFVPAEIPMMSVAQASWAKWIEQESNGRIKIEFLYGESVAKASEIADACASGMCDLTFWVPATAPGRALYSELSALPLLFSFPGSLNCALANYEIYQRYGDYIDSELPGLKIVGFHAVSPSHINTTNKPVHTMEDLEGLILRCEQPELGILGFTPEYCDAAETYDSLAKGVLDGTVMEYEGNYVWSHYQLCNYTTEVGLNISGNFIHLMNEDVYNSLPADLQALFQGENMKLVSYINGYNFDRDDSNFKVAIDDYRTGKGYPEVYVLPDDERQMWIETVLPIRNEWVAKAEAKGAPGQKMLNDIMMIIEQLEQQSPEENCPWCAEWYADMGAEGY